VYSVCQPPDAYNGCRATGYMGNGNVHASLSPQKYSYICCTRRILQGFGKTVALRSPPRLDVVAQATRKEGQLALQELQGCSPRLLNG
jgi:hypothetical protein